MSQHNFYIVDGKVYDLSDWIAKHPGGALWFARSNGRDISVAVHAYHKNPEAVRRILSKYEVDKPLHEVQDPTLNVPAFILPKHFDARHHTPVFNWSGPNFLTSLNEKILNPQMQSKLARADVAFDIVGGCLLAFHLLLMFVGVYYDVLPGWAFVILFVITRTSLAAVGHYHCHRKKNGVSDWGDSLFDMQYVGASIILFDGHVMLHHLYTNSPADVKRTVFTGMLELPPLWRLPVYTLQRFGQFLTGMFIRGLQILLAEKGAGQGSTLPPAAKVKQFFALHLLLVAEFVFCWATGHLGMWVAQFVLCLWWNLFLIVSSHDFEERETRANLMPGQDWGVFQIRNSFDMSVVGNRYVDCFLTAGLACHRVHHVLPQQRSGFANILSEAATRETCEAFEIPWAPTKNFVLDRLPRLIPFYLLAPTRSRGPVHPRGATAGVAGFLEQNFSWRALKMMTGFVFVGFLGIGSI